MMKYLNVNVLVTALLPVVAVVFMLSGCDSGEKVVDKVTGKEDVTQYQKLKKDIGKIAEQQEKKYQEALDDLKEGEERKETTR